MLREPIRKKEYKAIPPTPPARVTDLQRIYNLFFKHNDCNNLFEVLNKFSHVDGILNSGGTTVILEYKNRSNVQVYNYDTCLLEQKKYESLIASKNLFRAPVLYVTEYSECILIFDLTHVDPNALKWEVMNLQVSNSTSQTIDKYITMLPYSMASIIISKKDYLKKTYSELENYIKVLRQF